MTFENRHIYTKKVSNEGKKIEQHTAHVMSYMWEKHENFSVYSHTFLLYDEVLLPSLCTLRIRVFFHMQSRK
jgi:hypothetical protein